MKVFKRYIIGFSFGSLYALINYILLSHIMRSNIVGIILWGIQGLIFVFFWDIVSVISAKFLKESKVLSAFKGGVSGIGASSLSIAISLQGFYADSVADSEMWASLYSDLILYASGCGCLGVVIGLVIGRNWGKANP